MSEIAPGYSGKSLAAKLGIKPGFQIHVINGPDDYVRLVEPLPDGAVVVRRLTENVDLVHAFTASKSELRRLLESLRKEMKSTAVLWISWPKKAAKVPTDITEDTIRELALPLGFVDVKVCAVSDIWSGLKLVVRKTLR